MSITLSALQKQRRDSAANWTAENPTLLAGEIGIESDTGYWKVGDGSTAWTSLAYISGLGAEIPVSRLADGSARQLLQTAANGTDVEWTSNVDIPGTLDVTGAATFDAAVTIQGNLTVNGTTTTIDTQNLIVEDKNVIIGQVTTPTDVTADGGGITLKGTTDKTINWVDATDAWTSSERFSVPTGTAGAPSLTFTGDPNTGIYSPGADQVAISTGGSGRLFVAETVTAIKNPSGTASLEVGAGAAGDNTAAISLIGDTTYPLFGMRLLRSPGANGDSDVRHRGTGALRMTAIDAAPIALNTSNTERLRITATGLIGVQTSAPEAQLQIGGGITGGSAAFKGVFQLNGAPSSLEATSGLEFKTSSFGSGYGWKIDSLDVGTGVVLQFGTRQNSATWTNVMRLDASGRVGIGTSTFSDARESLIVAPASGQTATFSIIKTGSTNANASLFFGDTDSNYSGGITYENSTDAFAFRTNGSERFRCDSSGRLLVGTSTSRTSATGGDPLIQIEGTSAAAGISITRNSAGNPGGGLTLATTGGTTVGSTTAIPGSAGIGEINFSGHNGASFFIGAQISAANDQAGAWASGDCPGRLVFSTTADGASSPTERMRISSSGQVFIGKTADDNSTGITLATLGNAYIVRDGGACLGLNRLNSDGTIASFARSSTTVGTISVTTTATAYNTSSDYRLKENVIAVTDGITRLQQLKPSRFNFIADPAKTVDGFIAHEVQTVVPEAITGEKDAVDEDGNPIYQGIDQSKLVPLLTAALQEAVAKIESLEARLTAAGI